MELPEEEEPEPLELLEPELLEPEPELLEPEPEPPPLAEVVVSVPAPASYHSKVLPDSVIALVISS